MSDLVEFLRARRSEDKQIARYSGEPGRWDIGECVSADEPGRTEWEIVTEDGSVTARTATNMRAAHIARHDPARVMREVDRDRRIIDLHSVVSYEDEDGNDLGRGCAECGYSAEYSDRGGWCKTVRILGQPLADHPDYREEWKP